MVVCVFPTVDAYLFGMWFGKLNSFPKKTSLVGSVNRVPYYGYYCKLYVLRPLWVSMILGSEDVKTILFPVSQLQPHS